MKSGNALVLRYLASRVFYFGKPRLLRRSELWRMDACAAAQTVTI
jgi:hypothetical protein